MPVPAARPVVTSSHARPACLHLLLAWLLAICALPALAQHRLDASAPGSRLTGSVQYLTDDSRNRQLVDVMGPADQAVFAEPTGVVRTRYDDRPLWLRIRLVQTGQHGDWVLALPTTGIEDLRFFGPYDASGQSLAQPVRTGLDYPYASRALGSERYVFRVSLPRAGDYTAYLRVVAQTPQVVELTAWDPADYLASRQDKRLFDGLAYGILFTLLVYNLVLALVLRDRTYALYVANCTFALLTTASFNGHAARYLFPDWPAAIGHSYLLAPSLWLLCGVLFGRNFLELRGRSLTLERIAWVLAGCSLFALAMGLVSQISLAQRVNEAVSAAGVAFFIVASTIIGARGYRPAWWYLGGQVTLFFSVLIIVMGNWGLFASPFIAANGLQMGVLVEMIVFSVALSSRIRLIQAQKLDLQRKAGRFQHAAQTDPLTGLANRAGLEERAGQLFAGPGPHGLMMLDLDQFKPVNDAFGHQVGDQVLVVVARRLLAAVRDQDTVARVGGDEFVVLVDGVSDRALLLAQANRIQAVIREPVSFPQGAARLEVSLGVAIYPQDGDTLQALVARADQAMYQSKYARRAGAFGV